MAVILTAIFLFAVSVVLWPINPMIDVNGGGLPGIVFWTGMTLVVSSFPVRTPRGSVVSVAIAPILAATALGGPTAGAIVAFLGVTEARELRLQIPWYGSLYNHAITVIPTVLAGALYSVATGSTSAPTTVFTFGVLGLAGVAYFVINLTLSAAAVAAREGRSPIAVFVGDVRSFGLALVGLAPLAWLMALAYTTVGPLVAVLFALPLYTTRASYQGVVEIRKMFTQTVRALASAIDARDPSTKQHSDHVSQIAVEIGQVMGVSEGQLEELEWGGLLHDIGKIGIRDSVLLKPGRLDKAERMLMNEHPEKGAEILKGVEKLAPEIPLIRHHHEWYNGSGYPDRLIGENIPFLARILHVADAFEAMTAVRPYRLRPMSASQAMEELRKYSGIQFDPVVVDAFAKTAAAQGESVPEAVMEAPIPMLGQVAALRAKGTISASVPFKDS
jgi:putative nucleotidyltransferase with HDIG domain